MQRYIFCTKVVFSMHIKIYLKLKKIVTHKKELP